jgi:hypothetical protein
MSEGLATGVWRWKTGTEMGMVKVGIITRVQCHWDESDSVISRSDLGCSKHRTLQTKVPDTRDPYTLAPVYGIADVVYRSSDMQSPAARTSQQHLQNFSKLELFNTQYISTLLSSMVRERKQNASPFARHNTCLSSLP